MAVNDENMIIDNKDYLVTESVLNPKASPEEIAAFLKKNRITGHTVTTHMREGGIQRIVVTEKTLARENRREKLRNSLDMEFNSE
jgi:hypothetical protein